jgi:ring-1,2-phenylacetyl-CoA epoxidase subunit PaaE
VSPDEGELRIAVKAIDGGVFSTWANTHLAPGMTIDVMPPHGSFTWSFAPEAARRYVGIAGGSGITPILSLLRTTLSAEPCSRFALLYGNRDSGSVMFLEQLAAIKDRYLDRVEIYHFLDDEEGEIDLFNGRLDRDKCDAVLNGLIDPDAVDAFFICGPGPMMDAAEAALAARNVPKNRILIERFTAGRPTGVQAAAVAGLAEKAAGIRFAAIVDGRKRVVTFDPAAGNMLDSARSAGLPAPYACKAGVCATCRARVVSGQIEMAVNYGLNADELAQGYVLTCQAVPLSDDVVIDYDG